MFSNERKDRLPARLNHLSRIFRADCPLQPHPVPLRDQHFRRHLTFIHLDLLNLVALPVLQERKADELGVEDRVVGELIEDERLCPSESVPSVKVETLGDEEKVFGSFEERRSRSRDLLVRRVPFTK